MSKEVSLYHKELTNLRAIAKCYGSLADMQEHDAKTYETDHDHFYYLKGSADAAVKNRAVSEKAKEEYFALAKELTLLDNRRIVVDDGLVYLVIRSD